MMPERMVIMDMRKIQNQRACANRERERERESLLAQTLNNFMQK